MAFIPEGGVVGTTETADFSSGDHVFPRPTRKGIWVVAPASGGILTCQFENDAGDRAVPFGSGVTYAPFAITAVRQTGTTVTSVFGLLGDATS